MIPSVMIPSVMIPIVMIPSVMIPSVMILDKYHHICSITYWETNLLKVSSGMELVVKLIVCTNIYHIQQVEISV
jgi:hypothetical protein